MASKAELLAAYKLVSEDLKSELGKVKKLAKSDSTEAEREAYKAAADKLEFVRKAIDRAAEVKSKVKP